MLRLATIDKGEKSVFPGKKNYALIWNARDGQTPARFFEDSRRRSATALKSRITALQEERATSGQPDRYTYKLQDLAVVLAALDGRDSADFILEIVALPTRSGGWRRVEALEALIFSGVNVPAEAALGIVNSLIEQVGATGFYSDNQELWLLKSGLCLLPFVDIPAIGIARIREVVLQSRFPRHEMPDILSALGYSRSPDALALLREIAGSDATGIQLMVRPWIDALLANLGGPDSRELLLAFVEPGDNSFSPQLRLENHDAELLASKIANMARSEKDVEQQILRLSNQALATQQRQLLLKIIAALGTPDAILAGLLVMNDRSDPPIPYELWKAFEHLFLEHRAYGTSGNAYTIVSRSSNEVRKRLFELVLT